VIGVACVLALGATFAAGVVSARKGWGSSATKSTVLAGWKSWIGIAPRKNAAEAAGDRTRAERAERPVPAAPVLTFYHELTAPLAPAPPPPKAAAPPQPVRRDPSPPPRDDARPVLPVLAPAVASAVAPVAPPPTAPGSPAGGRFTIQVGAYRTRAAADALQAKLGGGGYEVYVVEAAAPEGVRYRVRVGSFVTQDAARAAAAKLADEQHVPIYVTPR
jgi:DedD protein